METPEHLFRREAGRLVAALTRIFGVRNLALAEDAVQDTFLRALEVWKFRGMPENPSAWLLASAKNRVLDILRRQRTVRTHAPELGRLLESEWTLAPTIDELFEPSKIKDSFLRLMFSCCDPGLPEEAQIAIILNILCGFSVDEIASAFVSTHAAVEKRISRAKKEMATANRLFDVTAVEDFRKRLPTVEKALYILFSEGYHGASSVSAIRSDLCREAMRLSAALLEQSSDPSPSTLALAALMCFDAARLPSRLDSYEDLVPLINQDRSKWDRDLIAEGLKFLNLSAAGVNLTEYHLEAAIASVHASALSIEETDWARIVSLYDMLMVKWSSPVIALNRAIALAQLYGPDRGLEEIASIANVERLAAYPFLAAAKGELELRRGSGAAARGHFGEALNLARNSMERRFFERRIEFSGKSQGQTTASNDGQAVDKGTRTS